MAFSNFSQPSYYLYEQGKCKLVLILNKLKTNSLDSVAPNVLVSRFLLDQSKVFDSELTALLFSRFIKLYLREKYKRDTY